MIRPSIYEIIVHQNLIAAMKLSECTIKEKITINPYVIFNLCVTPTILLGGYKLPDNYKIEDLRYFTKFDFPTKAQRPQSEF